MNAEVVNLRRARKAKQRTAEADADAAAGNRLRFGKSKVQRSLETAVAARDRRIFEAHRLDDRQTEINTTESNMAKDRPNGQ